jgi:thiaminase (transcriptional activator TenA)
MNLAKKLWAENEDLAQAALTHPFVRGLRSGNLPRETFQHYIAQDAFFLDAFARSYALALAHSPDQEGMRDFFELLAGVQEELRLHASYAEKWGVSLSDITPDSATLDYTNFLLGTAFLRGAGETCAAMTPCMRLYAFLGQSLAADTEHGDHQYMEWIRTYSSPDFEALAARLESLLERYATDTDAVHISYRRAMTLEVAFFEGQFEAIKR